MMSLPDFIKKQIVFVFTVEGEKLSFKNDNLILTGKDNKIKLQLTCYRVFILFIIGEFSLTSGLIQKSHKFAFPIYLMSRTFKVYDKLGSKMEGNVLLRRKQYNYQGLELARFVIKNKIRNQCILLERIRVKTDEIRETIVKLNDIICRINLFNGELHDLLGLEGNAAKLYFKQHFRELQWNGRKPRVKSDYINAILDIGYTILFNVVDSLLDVYGFDVYCGVLHKEFYMRKSLTCDLVEPFRVLIDNQTRKSINLGQFKEEDFVKVNGCYQLDWNQNKKYVLIFSQAIMEYKKEIFIYFQSYYRAFMKQKTTEEYSEFVYGEFLTDDTT